MHPLHLVFSQNVSDKSLRWVFLVVGTSKKANSIGNSEGLMHFSLVEIDWRATNHTPTPTIFTNTSNQSSKIAILFNVNESSRNYVFEDDIPSLQSPQGKGCNLWPGGYKLYVERVIVTNFGGGSLDC